MYYMQSFGFAGRSYNDYCRAQKEVTNIFAFIRKTSLVCKAVLLALFKCLVYLKNCKAIYPDVPQKYTAYC